MTPLEKEIVEDGKKQLAEHPAIQYANSMIALNAVRMGGKGYEGYEDLTQWLEKFLLQSLTKVRQATIEECKESEWDNATYDSAIDWWIKHYEGLEHMHIAPEVMYTITSILGRCFKQLKTKHPSSLTEPRV